MLGSVFQPLRDVSAAMLVLDLRAAGVQAEMADVPFDWFAAARPAVQPAAQPEGAAVARPPALGSGASFAAALAAVDKVGGNPAAGGVDNHGGKTENPRQEARTDVWVDGASGGLVVVMQGPGPLAGRARDLFGKMLAAIGHDGALAWVGAEGPADQAALVAAVQGLNPLKVLVLGQNILAHWLGKSLGVEGWQAAGTPLPGCEGLAVGVTYPPELLLAQPLFKRLAWQHLLKWRLTWSVA